MLFKKKKKGKDETKIQLTSSPVNTSLFSQDFFIHAPYHMI
jgi:hypothetical protein